MPARCPHGLWKFPNPYPRIGERCPACGIPFHVSDAGSLIIPYMARREIEDVRALAMLHALPLMADDGEITPTQKSRLRYRIARKRGWTTHDEDDSDLVGHPEDMAAV